jgi:prepilin-type N-terminal cleavage/methylation domain-containing protein
MSRLQVGVRIEAQRQRQLEQRAQVRSSRRQGFSLMELMTVVAIVGILSAVAIPTFSDYIYKARTAEATEFLGVIRLREESYRAEFGAYCATVPSGSTPNDPASLNTKSNLVPDPSTTQRDAKPFVSTTPWLQLGARPTSNVRFGYGVAAGIPTDAPSSLGWTTANADFWYVARAVGDLDADSLYVTFEIYSPTKGVWIGDANGNVITKGWE